jgi:hypothetical protein
VSIKIGSDSVAKRILSKYRSAKELIKKPRKKEVHMKEFNTEMSDEFSTLDHILNGGSSSVVQTRARKLNESIVKPTLSERSMLSRNESEYMKITASNSTHYKLGAPTNHLTHTRLDQKRI